MRLPWRTTRPQVLSAPPRNDSAASRCLPHLPRGRDRRRVVRGDLGGGRPAMVGAGRHVAAGLRGGSPSSPRRAWCSRAAARSPPSRPGHCSTPGWPPTGSPSPSITSRNWWTRLAGAQITTDESVAFALRETDQSQAPPGVLDLRGGLVRRVERLRRAWRAGRHGDQEHGARSAWTPRSPRSCSPWRCPRSPTGARGSPRGPARRSRWR